MTKTAKQIELLKRENSELREEVEQLKKQLELNTFILKYGEDGIEVKIGHPVLFPGITENCIVVRYVYGDKVVRIKSYMIGLLDLLSKATDYKIEVLLDSSSCIVFNIKLRFVNKIKVCSYIVNKESQTLSEYPYVDVMNCEEENEQ